MKNAILLLVFVFGLTASAVSQVISQDKPIEAVSAWSEEFAAKYANDGDVTTRWASNGDEGDKWITIDLEQVSDISAVRIVWEAAYSKNFTIDVSNDMLNWTNATTITGHSHPGQQDITGLSASGRYVRLNSTEGAFAHLSIFELSIYGAEGIPAAVATADTISVNKPVTTSSIWSEGFEGGLAVDGDMTTRWASSGTGPHWMSVDLQGTYTIDSVHVAWEGAFGKDFTIEVSDDGSAWTVAKTITGAESGGQKSYTDLDATGKFIRLNITAGAMGHVSIFELSAFGSEMIIEPISLKKPVSSSSFWGAGHEDSLAVDGNMDSRWASSGDEAPHWLTVDLEEVYSIDSIQIKWEAAYGADFTIDVSNDGLMWTAAKIVVGNESDGLQSLSGISGEGRFVRINITKTSGFAHVSIFEFSVYGGKSTAIVDNTIKSEGISVFPNPSTDVFRVNASFDSEAELWIYGIDGRLVYSDRFVKTKLIRPGDFGTKGIFVVKVKTGNNIYTEKVIVK